MVGNRKGAAKEMTTPSHAVGNNGSQKNSRLIQRKRGLIRASPPLGLGFSLKWMDFSAEKNQKEGQGGYNNFGITLRGSLPLGAGHKNLGDFRIDDHDGQEGNFMMRIQG